MTWWGCVEISLWLDWIEIEILLKFCKKLDMSASMLVKQAVEIGPCDMLIRAMMYGT